MFGKDIFSRYHIIMRFDIITIFPEIITTYINESILKRARQKKIIQINVHNPRVNTQDKHRTVDDRPYGGGPGMILKFLPIYKTLQKIRKSKQTRIIMLTPGGKQYTQRDAERLSKYKQLILLAGRYEGFDARLDKFVDEKISVGPYVLSGGELPALILVESIARLKPGVLGDRASIIDETYSKDLNYVEYPQYTRPETVVIKGQKLSVPKILLSGNHQDIKNWRQKKAKKR